MKNLINKLIVLTLVVLLGACSTEDELTEDWIEANEVESEVISGDLGTVDFSNYVAIGNSLTAGFMDGALYDDGQAASIPNLLAQQTQLVGGGDFNQPDINSVYGYNSAFSDLDNGVVAGRSYLDLIAQLPAAGANGDPLTDFSGDKTTLNNFGVPGLALKDLETPGYGFPDVGNPYFERFASDPNTTSVLADAVTAAPTFFSFWLGANDYLGYGIAGGVGNAPLADYSDTDFGADLTSALTQLTAGGAKGVIIDLPPVVTLPYFQAVTYDAIDLDTATADVLNTSFAAVNAAIQGTTLIPAEFGGGPTEDISNRLVSYAEGGNPVLVIDEELEDLGPYFDILELGGDITAQDRISLIPYEQSRPLTSTELVLFPAAVYLGVEADGDTAKLDTPIGVAIPLGFDYPTFATTFQYALVDGGGDQFYLTDEEQANIVTARATYNGVISAVVGGLNDAGADIGIVTLGDIFVDVLGLDAATAGALVLPTDAADGAYGIEIDGFTLTPDFAPNGIFSTDGIHPNPRGNAIVVNEVINAINSRWGASIPEVNVIDQRSVFFTED